MRARLRGHPDHPDGQSVDLVDCAHEPQDANVSHPAAGRPLGRHGPDGTLNALQLAGHLDIQVAARAP
jgi:hypothetical protein